MAKVTDNFYKDFPARMSDGRFVTDYSPNCNMNLSAQKNMSSWDYKLFLTRNAEKIMSHIHNYENSVYGCDNCNDPNIPLSHQFEQNCAKGGCHIKQVNPNGAGLL